MADTTPAPFALRPFRPAWWLRGAHAQTIGGKYLRSAAGVHLRRERLATPDGDFLDLDWATVQGRGSGPPAESPAPLVLVLHGLEGCARSSYVLETYRVLAARGLRGVGLNFRSCSGEVNRAQRFYHAGETTDLAFALDELQARTAGGVAAAIGFSLGGNVLLKYLGEQGSGAPLRAAAAVSVPFVLSAGAAMLERGMGRIYSRFFLRSLQRKFQQKANAVGDSCDHGRVLAARTLREFDDAVTAPLHGFRGVGHYYDSSSSASFLAGIRVPTLLLHAADDPFLPAGAIPRAAAAANPYLVAAFTECGGHVGFVGGRWPWAPEFWAEHEAARFISAQLPERARSPQAGPSPECAA